MVLELAPHVPILLICYHNTYYHYLYYYYHHYYHDYHYFIIIIIVIIITKIIMVISFMNIINWLTQYSFEYYCYLAIGFLLIILACFIFFFLSHNLRVFLFWFWINNLIGEGEGGISLFSSLCLYYSVRFNSHIICI